MDLYHVFNRGVEKRTIFMDGKDYARFVHDLFEFNDTRNAENVRYHMKYTGFVNPYIEREKIVDIHAWCLMKNHYHLLLSEKVEGGLIKFTRRLNVGYANYFNERYKRSGALFQGRTKKKLITSDSYFLHILNYIHLNPLDYHSESKNWRERKIKNMPYALEHLKKYKWSSYLDYCKTPNFPSILTTDLFNDVFGNVEQSTKKYLESIELEPIREFLLE